MVMTFCQVQWQINTTFHVHGFCRPMIDLLMASVGHSVGFATQLKIVQECHSMRSTRTCSLYYSYAGKHIKEEQPEGECILHYIGQATYSESCWWLASLF